MRVRPATALEVSALPFYAERPRANPHLPPPGYFFVDLEENRLRGLKGKLQLVLLPAAGGVGLMRYWLLAGTLCSGFLCGSIMGVAATLFGKLSCGILGKKLPRFGAPASFGVCVIIFCVFRWPIAVVVSMGLNWMAFGEAPRNGDAADCASPRGPGPLSKMAPVPNAASAAISIRRMVSPPLFPGHSFRYWCRAVRIAAAGPLSRPQSCG